MSANIQWIVYGNGKEYLVKVLLNEREVVLPVSAVAGVFDKWEDLRAYCRGRLVKVGALAAMDESGAGRPEKMLDYLKDLR